MNDQNRKKNTGLEYPYHFKSYAGKLHESVQIAQETHRNQIRRVKDTNDIF